MSRRLAAIVVHHNGALDPAHVERLRTRLEGDDVIHVVSCLRDLPAPAVEIVQAGGGTVVTLASLDDGYDFRGLVGDPAAVDLVTFLDTATLPTPGWRAGVEEAFDASAAAAIGGQMLVFQGTRTQNSFVAAPPVARIDALGRRRSNLEGHRASGARCAVDFLAPWTAVFRRNSGDWDVRFPIDRGCLWQTDLALELRSRGETVLFDGRLVIESRFEPGAQVAGSVDEHIQLWTRILWRRLRGWRRLGTLPTWLLVGTRSHPGILLWPYALKSRSHAQRVIAGWRSRRKALWTITKS